MQLPTGGDRCGKNCACYWWRASIPNDLERNEAPPAKARVHPNYSDNKGKGNTVSHWCHTSASNPVLETRRPLPQPSLNLPTTNRIFNTAPKIDPDSCRTSANSIKLNCTMGAVGWNESLTHVFFLSSFLRALLFVFGGLLDVLLWYHNQ